MSTARRPVRETTVAVAPGAKGPRFLDALKHLAEVHEV